MRGVCVFAILATSAAAVRADPAPVPLDEFSPAFLGMYRKLMEVEREIRTHTDRYGVDFDLARAVCLYESGANAGLASHAGAQGHFQVMPRTYRELKVTTNIEAGVKYLGQMIKQFGREDRAVAAYNGGPGRVGRAGGLPLETLQYVVGVGHYRSVLKQHDASLRHHAAQLGLVSVRGGDSWSTLADRLAVPAWQLRLHNPFLAGRALRVGAVVAFPPVVRPDLLTPIEGGGAYRVRHGDNYIKLAITLGVDVEGFRVENGLWQIQTVPPGVLVRIPLALDRADVVKAALGIAPLAPAVVAAVAGPPAQRPATRSTPTLVRNTPVTYRVKPGDTLSALARKHGTTVAAIQKANNLRRSSLKAGESLRIPQ